uniref:Uncharacterized protein n=1 Tax=Aegilops tauschii TaxID=37682 RepID=R7WDF7_AEGTA
MAGKEAVRTEILQQENKLVTTELEEIANWWELIGRSDKGGVRAGEIIIIAIKGASKIEVAHGVESMTRELGKKN